MAAEDADASFPSCPRCDQPVTDVTSTWPHTHIARPCGCRLAQGDVRELKHR